MYTHEESSSSDLWFPIVILVCCLVLIGSIFFYAHIQNNNPNRPISISWDAAMTEGGGITQVAPGAVVFDFPEENRDYEKFYKTEETVKAYLGENAERVQETMVRNGFRFSRYIYRNYGPLWFFK